MPIGYLSLTDVAALIQVKPDTVSAYLKRGQMPNPDVYVGRHPGWRESTIAKWVAKREGKA